ncbi:flavin reductase (DIM6/NTAB) family NADH-FMN oxidoreductase RutF [Algoriphagus sp. 4150]|uniref:flavin reductase family protein n=1 Tax=Algoriphagus sp. 4150 TaxID=2817756 RepID=UPI002855951A|nr:flavin reductase family protein [Algoriphagus sp. 4150]MDR7131785.1 flavin reductase (DIM6/NTAB) family NADH-FMN oxidoreductase RutF [Algoriphagus sp. 4150]
MHLLSEPSILYFGTPVVLISSENENGTYNLAPISSAFWLGWRCIIGIGTNTKTAQNLKRKGECVINLPSVNEAGIVNGLAMLTGCDSVPARKQAKGYRYEPNKFEITGATLMKSEIVSVPGVKECPVQLEAVVSAINPIGEDDISLKDRIVSVELKILRIRLEENILMDGDPNHVDPDKWRPLIMSFQQFYGLGKQVHPSALAQIPEHLYRQSAHP